MATIGTADGECGPGVQYSITILNEEFPSSAEDPGLRTFFAWGIDTLDQVPSLPPSLPPSLALSLAFWLDRLLCGSRVVARSLSSLALSLSRSLPLSLSSSLALFLSRSIRDEIVRGRGWELTRRRTVRGRGE
eukprot:3112795-Rhodomonas_salina.1